VPARQRGPILALAFVAGGRVLLSVGGGPIVEIAEEPVTIDQVVVRFLESGQLVPLAGFDAVWGFASDSEGRRLFLGSGRSYLSVWRIGVNGFEAIDRDRGGSPQRGVHHHRVGEQRPKRFPRKGPKQPAVDRPMAASPDGRLVAAPWDNIVEIWDADEMRQAAALERHPSEITGLAFRPDGRILASAAVDGTVRLWDTRDGRPLGRYDWGIGPVHCLAFAPDGMTMAAGGDSGLVVFDVDEPGC
jgi:WD40 repeat protein